MRKVMKNAMFVAAIGLLVASCGKYPEGPGISVRSKKARLAGEWEVEKYIDGDTGQESTPSSNDNSYVTYEKDGTYTWNDGSTSVTGTWEFTSDKENLKTEFTSGSFSVTDESKILRLTNDELWLEEIGGDGDQVHLKARG